jgi:iron complex transport system ATP-binding protein
MLVARDLAIGYGRHRIGSGLNVALRHGEVLALLGPNGGGKTTLLKTLLGLLPALDGTVDLHGRSLQAMSDRARARAIGYVPQTHAATFAFTVETLVLMGRTAHGGLFSPPSEKDREVARRMLERFGILPLADRPYTMISGGERQLALLARALAQEPEFVVLDEPTASLDFGNQGKVLREIRGLADSGHGVLFTTHDPNHARRTADRALLLRDGQCLAEGRIGDVLTQDTLQSLYGTRIRRVFDPDARQEVFLPD